MKNYQQLIGKKKQKQHISQVENNLDEIDDLIVYQIKEIQKSINILDLQT